ncbi:hypothetical protein DPMN_094066 [Dreissena polymorpha]|uniref:Uncharacterized protein n=1 Tax=Dreissena polymorpha TaxID=45954 RepID=A0A9D4L5E1_DREPO|nr:hypothetical protein DPMN_094066 [Dreissena polymorpha]
MFKIGQSGHSPCQTRATVHSFPLQDILRPGRGDHCKGKLYGSVEDLQSCGYLCKRANLSIQVIDTYYKKIISFSSFFVLFSCGTCHHYLLIN